MRKIDPNYTRNNDMISSKWRDLSHKIKKFNGIVRQKFQTRQSGKSDLDLMTEAQMQYQLEVGVIFNQLKCWEALRNSPICMEVPVFGHHSKRAKTPDTSNPSTPSSAFGAFDLNETDDDDDEVQVHEGELPRPIGRDRAKAKAKAKGKKPSSSNVDYNDNLQMIGQRFGDFNEKADERQRSRDMEFLSKDLSHLTGRVRELLEKEKERIYNKYA